MLSQKALDTSLPRLLVFGEALTDFVRSETATWHSVAGGSCWNVARVCATLGVKTGWAGALSSDLFGQEIVVLSQQAGLDARFIQVVDKPPLIAMVHQTSPPDYFFLGTDTADLAFDPEQLPPGWEKACEIAHFGCISLVREPLGARLVDIARRLRRGGAKISFDANYRNLMGPDYPAFFEDMARHADIVKVSDEDLTRIYPGRAVTDSVTALRTLTPGLVLLTCGSAGLTLWDGHTRIEQPAITVDVADTVGAGDACIGGFLASLSSMPERTLSDHLRFAAATASTVCMRAGAYAPSHAEVESLLASSAVRELQT